jgi:8-oxo-dGTP pyrophosphatase MutT (NUDIX family)
LIREFSAGGVVIRRFRGRPFMAAVRVKGGTVLALPKGHIDEGEGMAEAAAREVREETGVEATLVEKLGDVRYWYQRGGRRVAKRVAFFLFEFRSGSLEDHDDEIVEAKWMPLEQAVEELSHDGEREMVRKAISRRSGGR